VGCDSITQVIEVTARPALVVQLGNDTTFCAGGTVTLTADPGFTTYAWQQDGTGLPGTGPSITVSSPGAYTVLVADADGCAGADTVNVAMANAPEADFTHVSGGVCILDRVRFIATVQASTYAWSFGDGTQASGPVQDHAYLTPGTYAVQLTVADGPCSTSLTRQVVVLEGSAPADVPLIPNVFSPNGDGINDRFAPEGLEAFADCYTLVVYDRWGLAVFRSGSPNAFWDGSTDRGEPVPDGVYYYRLTLGETEHHGVVELLR
jgi:gliding motility-associated-like protein